MIRAGVGQSTKSSTVEAAEDAAKKAMTQAGIAQADAAVAFFTVDHVAHQRDLVETLSRVTGTDQVVGSSAAGILTTAGEIEGSEGLAVLAFASDQIQGRTFLFRPVRDRNEAVAAEIARAIAGAARDSLLTLLPDTYNCQPQRLLECIEELTGFLPLVGAGSSENGLARTTYQLCGDTITTNAVAGLHLSGSFETAIDVTQGCQPITDSMAITKAEKNLIFEINNRPATEVFTQVLKGPLADDLRRALMYVFVGLPAGKDDDRIAPGNYVVRNIIGLDRDKGILGVAEDVRDGQSMIFTLRDGQRAREDLIQMLERQAQRLEGRKPAFGFYFNCCARGSSLYGTPGIDAAYIRQSLGDFPLIGMFGGYELASLGGSHHLFAYTGVLALITDKLSR